MATPEEIKVFAPNSSNMKVFTYGAGYADVEFSPSETMNCLEATVTDEATVERLVAEEPFVWVEVEGD